MEERGEEARRSGRERGGGIAGKTESAGGSDDGARGREVPSADGSAEGGQKRVETVAGHKESAGKCRIRCRAWIAGASSDVCRRTRFGVAVGAGGEVQQKAGGGNGEQC